MKAYLQFGSSATLTPGPFQTVEVPAKLAEMGWQKRGQTWTATGYGARIPSAYTVKWEGRWRRVYVACFGNAGTAYLGKPGAWLCTVGIEG
jgi:hypothetical protein